MTWDTGAINRSTETIIGCSFKVLNTLGIGFLESVYQNALAYELEKHGVTVAQRTPIPVYYEGILVGKFEGDLIVEGKVIVELKSRPCGNITTGSLPSASTI